MGRGGYLGGSTIVYPGSDWFSGVVKREPSDTRTKRRRVSTNNCSAEALSFLKSVIHAEKEKLPIPRCPGGMSSDLVSEISRSGGALEWAKTRKEYRFYKTSSAPKASRSPQQAKATSKSQASAKQTPEERRSEIRQSYVTGILSADQKGRSVPDRPRVLREELALIGSNPDDIIRWAKQQPEARVFHDRALLKQAQSLPDQAVRVQFLTSVVGAMMRKQPLPGIPKKAAIILEPLLSEVSDFAAWARSQPEYAAIAHRVLSKIRKAPSTAPATARSKSVARITTATAPKSAIPREQLRPQDGEALKRGILLELQRSHPVASVKATIDAEAAAWALLQRDAHSQLGVSSTVDIRRFPAYLAIYKDIQAALRARRA